MPTEIETMFRSLRAQLRRSNGYQARAEIERLLHPLRQDPKRLEPFGFKVYSQNDEDGIIEEICRRLGVTEGRFVEIVVEGGLECNTLYLIHKGWRGTWVEGNQAFREPIKQKFASILGARLTLAPVMVDAESINELLKNFGAPEDLDFLSIDIDGNDIHLLEALAIRPKVICIEYNGKFPGNLIKQPIYDPSWSWQGTDYMGSSLKALTAMAATKGYRLVATNITGGNAFFVRNDLAGDLFPDDASPEHLYNPARYWLSRDHYLDIGHPADFGPYVDLR
jgi:hypothetical protein